MSRDGSPVCLLRNLRAGRCRGDWSRCGDASLGRIQAPPVVHLRDKALKHLKAAFDGKPLTEITPEDVERYVARRLDAGPAPGTVNRERAVLSHVFSKARAWGFVGANPVAGTERQDEANGAGRTGGPW